MTLGVGEPGVQEEDRLDTYGLFTLRLPVCLGSPVILSPLILHATFVSRLSVVWPTTSCDFWGLEDTNW